MVASIYTGTVRAYDVVTMLQRDGHPTALGEAIASYGRIFKTVQSGRRRRRRRDLTANGPPGRSSNERLMNADGSVPGRATAPRQSVHLAVHFPVAFSYRAQYV